MPVAVSRDVEAAVATLRSGGLVALPTETVYGLAGDASNPQAVARIFEVKGRPATHPVIVHLANADEVDRWAVGVPAWAHHLAATLWPGPLTLVLPRHPSVLDAITGGQPTVGLRVPAHPLTLEVLRGFGGGLAAPSANRYGQVSPTTAQHVVADLPLDPDRDLVLDGGPCPIGVESTIVGAWDETPRLLRSGAVTAAQLVELTGRAVELGPGGVRVPGSAAQHYAPRAAVVVVEPPELDATTRALERAGTTFGLIALASIPAPDAPHRRLAAPDDEAQYARVLYAALRAADNAGLDTVVAVLPPDLGVGRAIRDRLVRAAGAGPASR